MSESECERAATARDERLPYEAPALVDRGDLSALTQTAFVTAGADSGYS